MSVRGAIFLGVGSMVGAGIFALLGEAGTVAGAAVWISFLLAGVVAGLLGYTIVKLGVRYPSVRRAHRLPHRGLRQRPPGRHRLWLGYMSAIVIVGAMVAVSFGSYATSLFIGAGRGGGLGQRLHLGRRRCGRWASTSIGVAHRRPRADGDRARRARGLRGVHRRDGQRSVDWSLLAFSGYPSLLGHRVQRRADVLRLPRLQRDHVLRGRPARTRRAGCRVAMYTALGPDGGPVRPDLARRVRHAHGRRGGPATARRRSPRRPGPRWATPAS